MRFFITLLLAFVVALPQQWSLAQSLLAPALVQTRDSWQSVRTNNLFVIGNTDPESLRQVAAWLEFFHAAFERLVSRSVGNSSVPTTVVVFRDEASFLPFKPLYQGKPLNLAGYFQAGDEVNYIAIKLDRNERQRDSYSTAFHEYVHLHLRQNVPGVPLWLNEGLAEFYSSMQFSDSEVTIGAPIGFYLRLLRYVKALGGATAFNALTSRVTKGTLDIVGISRNGSFEIYSQAPNKTLSVIAAHPIGSVKLGFNGNIGWAHSVNGLRRLKGLELGALQRDSDFYGTVRLKNVFAKVSLLGKSKIGYREVYVLELQPASGPSERLFLDIETHLPVRLNAIRTNGGQPTAVEIYYDDWREVDGIKIPFRISQSFSGRALAFTVKEIRHNVALDAKLFDAPAK